MKAGRWSRSSAQIDYSGGVPDTSFSLWLPRLLKPPLVSAASPPSSAASNHRALNIVQQSPNTQNSYKKSYASFLPYIMLKSHLADRLALKDPSPKKFYCPNMPFIIPPIHSGLFYLSPHSSIAQSFTSSSKMRARRSIRHSV